MEFAFAVTYNPYHQQPLIVTMGR